MPTPMDRPHFRVSPQVLGPLGAEQLQDPALAVLELIKNSWDADASRVAVSIDGRGAAARVVVADNGHGMSRAQFDSRWLVIGASHKRTAAKSEHGRPLIGEKGLGRLATFALGRTIRIDSARSGEPGFRANINWEQLRASATLEDYEIDISPARRRHGTRVEVAALNTEWTHAHTQFLVRHAEFLASVPGERFAIALRVNGKRHHLEDPTSTIDRLAEAEFELKVSATGAPTIVRCVVGGQDLRGVLFRPMKDEHQDRRLSGLSVVLRFFRRDEAARTLGDTLARNEVKDALERYQGVRIFRDGINVPPYGLYGDDWAGLEKQRTATGGPTMVPGNSQLVGSVYLSRDQHKHLVITAGRSGFADQSAVSGVAHYVRWAVREIGTARRAAKLGLQSGEVPPRVDDRKGGPPEAAEAKAKQALDEVMRIRMVQQDPELRRVVTEASLAVKSALADSEEALRLYAQLASTGIAATSFAHELRTEFDVITEALSELARGKKPDSELLRLLNASWSRLKAFAALFKVIPVKVRRQRATLTPSEMKRSASTILGLAPPDKVQTRVAVASASVRVVPAEFDSILLNLISNAVKAVAESENSDEGLITVSLSIRGTDLDIKVADNGCGVSSRVASVMFEPLEGKFAEGTGMGLPIVKFIAERYKGRVFLGPTPPAGHVTEFVTTLRNVVE